MRPALVSSSPKELVRCLCCIDLLPLLDFLRTALLEVECSEPFSMSSLFEVFGIRLLLFDLRGIGDALTLLFDLLGMGEVVLMLLLGRLGIGDLAVLAVLLERLGMSEAVASCSTDDRRLLGL